MLTNPNFQTYNQPKYPQHVDMSTSLVKCNIEALKIIIEYMDSFSYTNLVSSHQDLQYLKSDKTIGHNTTYRVMRLIEAIMDHGRSVFLNGLGGAGKTTAISKLVKVLKRQNINYVLTATTGRACLNYQDAVTLHSFSGIGKGTKKYDAIELEIDTYEEKHPGQVPPRYKKWQSIQVFIVDEVSMLGRRTLEKIDMIARRSRRCNAPFGGLQLVFSGDILQFPPIGDQFFFQSPVFDQLQLVPICLTFLHRQKSDLEFANMCSRIRTGNTSEKDYEMLEAKAAEYDNTNQSHCVLLENGFKSPFIAPRHKECDAVNLLEFDTVESKNIVLTRNADDSILESVYSPERLKNIMVPCTSMTLAAGLALVGKIMNYKAAKTLEFKIGAQYLLTRNVNSKERQVNGSICIFEMDEKQVATLRFTNGSTLTLDKVLNTEYQKVFGTNNIFIRREQYSLVLGYSITSHASQGVTLERASMNLAKIPFAAAAYVMLSRIRAWSGVFLTGFDRKSIKVNQIAKRKVQEMEDQVIVPFVRQVRRHFVRIDD